MAKPREDVIVRVSNKTRTRARSAAAAAGLTMIDWMEAVVCAVTDDPDMGAPSQVIRHKVAPKPRRRVLECAECGAPSKDPGGRHRLHGPDCALFNRNRMPGEPE